VPVSWHQSIRGLAASRAQAQRAGLSSSPYQNSDAERVFVVPQFCEGAIGNRGHEFFDRINKGVESCSGHDVTLAALGCHVPVRT
jgi:hypothetical protein